MFTFGVRESTVELVSWYKKKTVLLTGGAIIGEKDHSDIGKYCAPERTPDFRSEVASNSPSKRSLSRSTEDALKSAHEGFLVVTQSQAKERSVGVRHGSTLLHLLQNNY